MRVLVLITDIYFLITNGWFYHLLKSNFSIIIFYLQIICNLI